MLLSLSMDVCTFSFSVQFVLVWLFGQNGPNVTVLEYGCFHILFLRTVRVVQDDTVVPCNGMKKVFCTLRTCMWICISWWWRHSVHLCVLYVCKTCVCVQLHPDGAIWQWRSEGHCVRLGRQQSRSLWGTDSRRDCLQDVQGTDNENNNKTCNNNDDNGHHYIHKLFLR